MMWINPSLEISYSWCINMNYLADTLKDLEKKVAQIEIELANVRNHLALINANIKDKKRPSLNFPVDSYGSWPQDLSLRRKDIYNEWGR
jgi:hypothetical protein